MPNSIFINYRRDDVRDMAARISDRLSESFGSLSVFMDIDSLLPGQRFEDQLKKALDACDVFIVILGPRSEDLLGARAKERDYVRAEIAAALVRPINIIPALIDGAQLPKRVGRIRSTQIR